MMKVNHLIVIVLLGGLSGAGAPLPAQADDDYLEARRLLSNGEILSLETILKKISRSFPGKVIEVDLEKEDGLIVYEVEILNDKGVVKEVYMNAKTGELLSVKEDD